MHGSSAVLVAASQDHILYVFFVTTVGYDSLLVGGYCVDLGLIERVQLYSVFPCRMGNPNGLVFLVTASHPGPLVFAGYHAVLVRASVDTGDELEGLRPVKVEVSMILSCLPCKRHTL